MCAMVFDRYGGPDVLCEERARSGAARWGCLDPGRHDLLAARDAGLTLLLGGCGAASRLNLKK
jgi:hypothetical protein